MSCDQIVRWYSAGAVLHEEPCAMLGEHVKHRTAGARQKMKRSKARHDKTPAGRASRNRQAAAYNRRRWRRDPEYRRNKIAASTKWAQEHPFEMAMLKLKYHSAGVLAKIEELA